MTSATSASAKINTGAQAEPQKDVGSKNLEEVVDRYAPLVKRIAHHLLLRMPASVQIDDLLSLIHI